MPLHDTKWEELCNYYRPPEGQHHKLKTFQQTWLQQSINFGQQTNTKETDRRTCHEEILSVQINDMQKSMYNAKFGNTEAMALFDSGTMLSCISEQFYDYIHWIEPSMVIDTSTGPAIIITSALAEELTNLGWCRLHIKLVQKLLNITFKSSKTWNKTLYKASTSKEHSKYHKI